MLLLLLLLRIRPAEFFDRRTNDFVREKREFFAFERQADELDVDLIELHVEATGEIWSSGRSKDSSDVGSGGCEHIEC